MDLQLGPASRPRILLHPEDGLRAVMERAPQAEAAAVRWVERTRPVWSWLAREWRVLGTIAAGLLIVAVLLHAIFGANGMVVYREKRAEMKTLEDQVDRLQKENATDAERIKELKFDPAAIEKEAREQLHYSRKGEIIFVAPSPPPQKSPIFRAGNDKTGPTN
jgi:cell division protein FtsB